MKNLLIIFVMLLPFITMAQDDGGNATNEFGSLRIDILAPGVSYEFQVSELTTVVVGARLAFAGGTVNIGNQSESYFLMAPSFHGEFRYFFNRNKRLEKGKTVYNNSGLFLGAGGSFNTRDIYSSNSNYIARVAAAVGPVFGVQRTWDNNLQLGFSIGFGLNWDEIEDASINGVGNFNFSYVITPKRSK